MNRQDYRLEAIALHHIGPFDDLKIEFKPMPASAQSANGKAEVHLFTGPNGCGKSSLLYALAGIFAEIHATSLPIFTRFREQGVSVNFRFNCVLGGYGIEVNKAYGFKHYVTNNLGSYVVFDWNSINGFYFGYDHFRDNKPNTLFQYKHSSSRINRDSSGVEAKLTFAAFSYSGHRAIEDVKLDAIQSITNPPLENALSFNKTVRPQILLRWIANNRTQSALAKADGDAAAAEKYDRSLKRITDLIKDVCDLEIEFRLKREPLAVTILANGAVLNFDSLPDGLISIISWVADLTLRLESIPWVTEADPFEQPIILLLDEIDIHLHPKWQRRVLPAVQKLLPNAQIFATTHSPFVVGSVEDAWVYRLPEPATVSGPLVVEGIPSGAGKSYRLILDEVFGVSQEFDVATERLLDQFYDLRQAFLQSPQDSAELLNLAKAITTHSEEAGQIIARELRQITRITGRELSLA